MPTAATPKQPSPLAAANDDGPPSVAAAANMKPVADTRAEESSGHWQSVTNVVMSEDTVEETSEHLALTSSTLGLGDVNAVVFTVDSEFATTAIRACSADRSVILATTLVKVAQAIREENAGVLVTDFTNNGAILQKIIAALKKYMPELVTIVVNNGRDTTDMINLINFGQVFRYVLKPIEPDRLRDDINAAVIRHLYLLNNPESIKRHEVNASPRTTEPSNTVNDFLGRVRGRPTK
jgi:DNA-binding NarL/FixJ family response regulator